MNSVTSFLENIISVEDSQSTSNGKEQPRFFGDRSRRSSQYSADGSILEFSVDPKDKAGTSNAGENANAENGDAEGLATPKLPNQTKVSDFWYLEDDQKKVANQLTDRIMEKLLSVMLSLEVKPGSDQDLRTFIHKTRPPLSVHLMSINSTQMAQKATPVFELIDEISFAIGWYNPWHTIGVSMLATLLVLQPYLLTALPPSMLLKKYLVPSYLKLYPPDPSVVDHQYTFNNPLLHSGAPLRKYEPPKQISQFSREFVMNFTDLQNHLVLYIRAYDAVVNWGQHYFLFEDPRLSSVVFLALICTIVVNLLALPHIVPIFIRLFPVKLLTLALVWSAVALTHPFVRQKVMDTFDTEEAHEARRDRTDRLERALMMAFAEDNESEADVVGEVEVYELHSLNANKIWEPIGFTSDFFALNHPERYSKELATGIESPDLEPVSSSTSAESGGNRTTSYMEEEPVNSIFRKATLAEIKPPKHWRYAEEQWQVDLDPFVWVNASYIMDLVNIDTDEKWVYDFVQDEDSCDGQVFRRRRWVRQCIRDTVPAKEKDLLSNVTSPERFSKTISTLLSGTTTA